MDIKTFFATAQTLPSNVSILIRGPHGIGKSMLAKKLQLRWKLDKLIDKRISQMSEGDMIGLPELENGTTRFCHPDWFVEACESPVLMLLDEYNRGLVEVMQAGFQIVYDREMNGKKLHPDTRVVVCINDSDNYQITEMDPALLDRFWVCDLSPSVEEWCDWAKTEDTEMKKAPFDENLVNYIAANPSRLDPNTQAGPRDRTQSRRSWHRFHDIARKAGLFDADLLPPGSTCPTSEVLFDLATGFMGADTASSFVSYLRTLDRQVSADDVLNGYDKVQGRLEKQGPDKWNRLIESIAEHSHLHLLTDEQAVNVGKFVNDLKKLSGELVVGFWTKMAKDPDKEGKVAANVKAIHPYIVNCILSIFGKGNPTKGDSEEAAAE